MKRLQLPSYSSSTVATVPLLTHEKAGVRFGAIISNSVLLNYSTLNRKSSPPLCTGTPPLIAFSKGMYAQVTRCHEVTDEVSPVRFGVLHWKSHSNFLRPSPITFSFISYRSYLRSQRSSRCCRPDPCLRRPYRDLPDRLPGTARTSFQRWGRMPFRALRCPP